MLDIIILHWFHRLGYVRNPFCISPGGNRDKGILFDDQIILIQFSRILHNLGSPRVAPILPDFQQFLPDHLHQFPFAGKNPFIPGDSLLQFIELILEFFPFQTLKTGEPHIQNGLGLDPVQTEALHQLFPGIIIGTADHPNHFIDIVQRNEQTFQNMSPFPRLFQVEFRPPGDHLFLKSNVLFQHFPQIQCLRFAVHQRQHDRTEIFLQRTVLVQIIQDDLCISILPEFNDNPDSLPGRFIPDFRNTLDLPGLDQFRHFLDHLRLVHAVRNLRDDDLLSPPAEGLNAAFRPHPDPSGAGAVEFSDPGLSQNLCTRREIRPLDDRDQVIYGAVRVFDHINRCVNGIAQIVGWDIRRHTDGNPAGTIHQQIRIPGRQNGRLHFLTVEIRHEIHGILFNIPNHLHGKRRHSRLGIPLGRSTVSINRTEVSVTVHQRVAHGKILGHPDHRIIDGRISVGMILTHDFTDDSGRFLVRLVRRNAQLLHTIEDTPVHRFHTVPDIRQRPADDDTHGVIQITFLHLVRQTVYFHLPVFGFIMIFDFLFFRFPCHFPLS